MSLEPSVRDQVGQLIEQLDTRTLIESYDAESDIPLRNRVDVAMLQMRGAFQPQPTFASEELATRVGAFWCEIVRSDVELDLRRGLGAIEESQADGQRLTQLALADGDCSTFAAYAAARWNDGAGKVLYRSGSHARGRMSFAEACAIADKRDLWWARPDLHSNLLRAQLEEARQAASDPLAPQIASIEDQLADLENACVDEGRMRGIPLDGSRKPRNVHEIEFLRGYSSVLHNLSFGLMRSPARSLEFSRRASVISAVLGDSYRLAQALNHQARLISMHYKDLDLDREEARELYKITRGLPWVRGQHIADQQLAILDGTLAGARELRELLARLAPEGFTHGGSAGLDIDLRFFTLTAYLKLATDIASRDRSTEAAELLKDAQARELEMARSIRQLIALPAYKRAYNGAVRPAYLRQIERELVAEEHDSGSPRGSAERVLSLVEEVSGRELLDLMASSDLPLLPPPTSADTQSVRHAASPVTGPVVSPGKRAADDPRRSAADQGRRRRAGLQAAENEEDRQADRLAMVAREKEFEDQFLRRPLDAAPADREIAAKAAMFVLNHPGTCIVRYFGYGTGDAAGKPARLGALVIRDGHSRVMLCRDYAAVTELVTSILDVAVPTEQHSREIWDQLIAPVWAEVTKTAGLRHLVIIPCDDLFAIPFHIASEHGYARRSAPLGARISMSQSVSLTAFISRGRNLLRRQYVSPDDNLSALVFRDEDVSGNELLRARWDPKYLRIAGTPPDGLSGSYQRFPGDWTGLAALAKVEPEFFVYVGHGRYASGYRELGPYLLMEEAGRLTAHDIALRLRLPRNRLTILGACLAGQGAQTGTGDVAGFLRSFMAAGAGAIAVPLWNVADDAMALTAGYLLAQSRAAARSGGVFDVVQVLHEHYRKQTSGRWIDELPVALYT